MSSKVQLGETVQFAIWPKDESEDPGTPDPPEDTDRGAVHRSGSKVIKSGNGRAGVSAAFLSLVDQLVHQHKVEVARVDYGSKTSNFSKSFDLPQASTMDMERLVSAASECKSEGKTDGDGSRRSRGSHDHSQDSAASAAGHSQPLASPGLMRSPTVAKVMCHHHGDLREMHASKILDAFDMNRLLEQEEHEEEERYVLRSLKTNATFQTFDWSEMEKESLCTKMGVFMQSKSYEFTISCILALNILWMAAELEVEGRAAGVPLGVYSGSSDISDWNVIAQNGDIVFAFIFIVDVVLRVSVLRWKFFQVWLNFVDLGVAVTSLTEVVLGMTSIGGSDNVALPLSPTLFKLLRIGKLARAIRMISMTTMLLSLQLLIKCLAASRGMLFWSFCLLSFVQCVAGMILATLCQGYIEDPMHDVKVREQVFRYYGTFTRTFLSMFEILFANWSPPCRILVENVSEWFSVFFLLYRCVLGFAVINVVNSVFVQQTMKTASSDEDLAFRQKQKDIASYTRKVRKLFQTMDASGDGTINLEEFSKLVTNPKLNFWMSQLELEYHDLMSLFEFLDNGDGEITLTEFIEGAAKLRGQAKALDIWRMETKVEVLFEEVLRMLRTGGHGPVTPVEVMEIEDSVHLQRTASIQDIFANSSYKHLGTAIRAGDSNHDTNIFEAIEEVSEASDASGVSAVSRRKSHRGSGG